MVAHTPKWGITIEEAGDAADMPAASGRSAASVEAALDRLQTESSGLAGSLAAGRVAKTGDTMTGPLTIEQGPGGGALRLGGPYLGAWWLHRNPTSGDLYVQQADTTGGAAGTVSMIVRRTTNTVEIPGGLVVTGAVTVSDASLPQNTSPTDDNNRRWMIYDATSGRVKNMPDLTFRLYVMTLAGASSARYKTGIGTPATTPTIAQLQPRAYEWTDEAHMLTQPGQRYGLIAEETAAVDERLVIRDPDGQVQGLDTHALIAALITEVNDLRARLDRLDVKS